MFFDPFTAIMALIILAFIGTLAVFFRIWRELEALRDHMADIRESFRLYAVDMAQQNRDLAAAVRDLRAMTGRREPGDEALGDLLERGLPDLARRFPPEQPPVEKKTAPGPEQRAERTEERAAQAQRRAERTEQRAERTEQRAERTEQRAAQAQQRSPQPDPFTGQPDPFTMPRDPFAGQKGPFAMLRDPRADGPSATPVPPVPPFVNPPVPPVAPAAPVAPLAAPVPPAASAPGDGPDPDALGPDALGPDGENDIFNHLGAFDTDKNRS